MSLEKTIIKAQSAAHKTFEYKARELATGVSNVAQQFVDRDAARSPDFKISSLVAQQAGISQLESELHQDKINAQVLERLKEVEERAYQEGFELGQVEGTEKAFQENKVALLEKLESMATLLKRMEDLKTQLFVDNEAGLVELVFLTAKKMALRDLTENREAVHKILKDVVGEIQADEQVVVNLSNEDMYFLETLQDKSGKRIENLERMKFVANERIKPGGCLIETQFGNVDATVEERVERTWQALLTRVPKNAPGAATEDLKDDSDPKD